MSHLSAKIGLTALKAKVHKLDIYRLANVSNGLNNGLI